MKAAKTAPKMTPKMTKSTREREVLFGLIEMYLETGKPVGSNTLKDSRFDQFSSATIRNYFSKLEEEGFLDQAHSSGGRAPTEKAFRLYAQEFLDHGVIESKALDEIEAISKVETKEVVSVIRKTVDELSRLANAPAFISFPRFDRDFLNDIKVVPIDASRALLVMITDFGSILTEIVETNHKLSLIAAKRIEAYLHFRLSGQEKPEQLEPEEEMLGQRLYNEAAIRFLVGYSNFMEEDLVHAGFSRMLQYPEFRDSTALAESLALLENKTSLRHLLRDTMAHDALRYWIGEDLSGFGDKSNGMAAIAIPYRIHSQIVGAFGILGPMRLPYRELFGLLKALSLSLSTCLTKNLYKFKLTFRQPGLVHLMIPESQLPRIEYTSIKLIEPKKGN